MHKLMTIIFVATALAAILVPLTQLVAVQGVTGIKRLLNFRKRKILRSYIEECSIPKLAFLHPTYKEEHDRGLLVIGWDLDNDGWSRVRKTIAKILLYHFPEGLDPSKIKTEPSSRKSITLHELPASEQEISRYVLTLVDRIGNQLPKLHDNIIKYEELLSFAKGRGISVYFEPLPKEMKSMLFYFKGKGFIVINKDCSFNGKWYLLAYELGHDLLHYHHNLNQPSLSSAVDYLNNVEFFAAADYFAQCVFLPRTLIEEWCEISKFNGEQVVKEMVDYTERELSKPEGFSQATKSLIEMKMTNRLHVCGNLYVKNKNKEWKIRPPKRTVYVKMGEQTEV